MSDKIHKTTCDEPNCGRTDTVEYKRLWGDAERSNYNPNGVYSVFWCPAHRRRGDEHPVDCDENQVLARALEGSNAKRWHALDTGIALQRAKRNDFDREKADAALRQRHPRYLATDEGYDRVEFRFDQGDRRIVLTLAQVSYWKDSFYSGSCWRTGWNASLSGGAEIELPVASFGTLSAALSLLYSTLCVGSDGDTGLGRLLRGSVLAEAPVLFRKDAEARAASPMPNTDWKEALAVAAGMLIDAPFGLPWQDHLCFQPGCCEPAVGRVLPNRLTDQCGNYLDSSELYGSVYRAFCTKHMKRGDSDREDNDANYSKDYDRPVFVFDYLAGEGRPYRTYSTTSPDGLVDALIGMELRTGIVILRDKSEMVAVRRAFQMRGWTLDGANVTDGFRRLLLDGSTQWSADRIRAWMAAAPTRADA